MANETTVERPDPVARQLPWSADGVGFQWEPGFGPPSVDEALAQADLNWDVELRTAGYHNDKGNFVVDPGGRRYVVRSDNGQSLGVVGKNYVPLSNRDAFSFANELASQSGGEFASAWSERDGVIVGMAMRLGNEIELVEGDASQRYLVLQTSHNGTRSIQCGVDYFQVDCQNQLPRLGRGAALQWRGFHNQSMERRMAQAAETLQLADDYQLRFQKKMQELADVKVTDKMFESIITSTLSDLTLSDRAAENAFSEIEIAWHDSSTMKKNLRNTGYGTLHAVTEYWDHLRDYKTDAARFGVNQYGNGFKHRNLVARRLEKMAA